MPANSYFDWPSRPANQRFVAYDTVRSGDVNAALDLASAGFALLPSPYDINAGRGNFAPDTGTPNTYVVALSAQVNALQQGLQVRFRALNSNTGASTLNVNGLGAVALVGQDGATALAAGAITAGQMVTAEYDGTRFQLRTSATALSQDPAAIQKQSYTAAATTGAGGAYAIALAPVLTAYAQGVSMMVTFGVASLASPTLAVNGLANPPQMVKQLYDGTYTNIAAGDIPAGHTSRVTLLSPTQAWVETLPPQAVPTLFQLSARNKARNGRMDIAQRGATFAAIANATYSLDGWKRLGSGAQVVTHSQQLNSNAASEFLNVLRVAVTTANAAPAAADVELLIQPIEGFLVRDLQGNPIAIRFEVKSPKAGTHCVSLANTGVDRSYILTYNVAAANTPQVVTLALPGGLITAGTWNWTNGVGVQLRFALMAGANWQAAAGAWQAGNFAATAAQVNCMDTIGNAFDVTGVQMEKASISTPFEHRDIALETMLCQRYLELTEIVHATTPSSTQNMTSGWHVEKRASPSISTTQISGTGMPTLSLTSSGRALFQSGAPSGFGTMQATISAEL